MTGFSKMSIQRSVRLFLSALRYSLPQQELVDRLLFPHALHNQPIQVNKQSAAKTTGDPAHRQRHGLSDFFFSYFFLLKAKQENILGENKISKLEKETCCRWNMLLPSGLHFWGSLMESQTLLTNLISSVYVCWHQEINLETRWSGHSLHS